MLMNISSKVFSIPADQENKKNDAIGWSVDTKIQKLFICICFVTSNNVNILIEIFQRAKYLHGVNIYLHKRIFDLTEK
jgi:hypothetical protein